MTYIMWPIDQDKMIRWGFQLNSMYEDSHESRHLDRLEYAGPTYRCPNVQKLCFSRSYSIPSENE